MRKLLNLFFYLYLIGKSVQLFSFLPFLLLYNKWCIAYLLINPFTKDSAKEGLYIRVGGISKQVDMFTG